MSSILDEINAAMGIDDTLININIKEFISKVKSVMVSILKNGYGEREIFTGVYFGGIKGHNIINVVGADGLLCFVSIMYTKESLLNDINVTVNGELIQDLLKSLKPSMDNISLDVQKDNVVFKCDGSNSTFPIMKKRSPWLMTNLPRVFGAERFSPPTSCIIWMLSLSIKQINDIRIKMKSLKVAWIREQEIFFYENGAKLYILAKDVTEEESVTTKLFETKTKYTMNIPHICVLSGEVFYKLLQGNPKGNYDLIAYTDNTSKGGRDCPLHLKSKDHYRFAMPIKSDLATQGIDVDLEFKPLCLGEN